MIAPLSQDQCLVRKAEVSDQIAGYGHLIVDECHHLSALSFELVARRSKARYVLGLSATVTRKDGHHPNRARYLGEGFDDSRLDTLFLVMPISCPGTRAEYFGPLHCDHDGKREFIVYDSVDRAVPVLARMAAKRE